jgi:hypothetical protein
VPGVPCLQATATSRRRPSLEMCDLSIKPVLAFEHAGDYRLYMGITIFPNAAEAIRAGFEIASPVPDSEGFLHARIRTPKGWARVLVRPNVIR